VDLIGVASEDVGGLGGGRGWGECLCRRHRGVVVKCGASSPSKREIRRDTRWMSRLSPRLDDITMYFLKPSLS
jgi:hypothetical protein